MAYHHEYFEFDGPQSYRDVSGRAILCKGGGGGGKAVVGLVASIAIPFAAPVIAESIGLSAAVGSATVGAGLVGAGLGAGVAAMTGGNPWMGALTGGIGGGVGGYNNLSMDSIFGGASTAAPVETAAVAPVQGMEGVAAGAQPAATSGIVAGESSGMMSVPGQYGPMSVPGQAGGEFNLTNALNGGGFTNTLDAAPGAAAEASASTPGGFDTEAFNQALGPQPGVDGSPSIAQKVQAGLQGIPGKIGDALSNPDTYLKLGGQYAMGKLMSPDPSNLNSYLNDMRGAQDRVTNFNMDMATRKAGIGDQLQSVAANYNPEYTAQQAENSARSTTAGQWADTEADLRRKGYDQNYINSMKNKFDVGASQNWGTAYDQGWNRGQNQRNSTYQAAGSMYGPVSQPTAGLATDYLSLYNSQANAAKAMGDSLENVFNTSDKKTNQNITPAK